MQTFSRENQSQVEQFTLSNIEGLNLRDLRTRLARVENLIRTHEQQRRESPVDNFEDSSSMDALLNAKIQLKERITELEEEERKKSLRKKMMTGVLVGLVFMGLVLAPMEPPPPRLKTPTCLFNFCMGLGNFQKTILP